MVSVRSFLNPQGPNDLLLNSQYQTLQETIRCPLVQTLKVLLGTEGGLTQCDVGGHNVVRSASSPTKLHFAERICDFNPELPCDHKHADLEGHCQS